MCILQKEVGGKLFPPGGDRVESWSGLVNQQDATFTQDSDIRFAQLPLTIDLDSCLFTWKNINKLKLWILNRCLPCLRFLHYKFPKGGVMCHYYVKIIRSGVLGDYHLVYVIFSCNNSDCSSMLWHVFEENKNILIYDSFMTIYCFYIIILPMKVCDM